MLFVFSGNLSLQNVVKPVDNHFRYSRDGTILDKVNWVDLHKINEKVYLQSGCGACYAIVTAALVESHYAIVYAEKALVPLSAQQIVDCSKGIFKNLGCGGGLVSFSLDYIRGAGGLNSESSYPYRNRENHECMFNSDKIEATIYGPCFLNKDTEEEIRYHIANKGPVAAMINVCDKLSAYDRGIFSHHCPKIIENSRWKNGHAVLIVGYDSQHGTDYWIVKNSWGPNWGEKGYFRILRGLNLCNIETNAVSVYITNPKQPTPQKDELKHR